VKPPVWKTKEGFEIPITQMLDYHLLNVIGYQEKFAQKYHPDDWQKYLSEMYFFMVGEGVYRNIAECTDRALSLKIECLYNLIEKNAKKQGETVKFLSGSKQNYRCATCAQCFDSRDKVIALGTTIQFYKLCPKCYRKQRDGISDHIDRSNPNLLGEDLGTKPRTRYGHSLTGNAENNTGEDEVEILDWEDDYRWSVDDEDRGW
jgi:hypothetical protein